ncbi:hypothetical protein RG2014_08 [Delftia phage RG-2014]|uniref:Uncharacterized protein n=1 Tax=Delftia phage RG-2014 TaxID=1563661 RepID=A0A097PAI1_9CAUD|nr:hypothetical protein RG2014_08 [Delftia phage RG-2014]AIU44262.1 hypothetical protein RG2014_08 [Delftia phage RG-2014]
MHYAITGLSQEQVLHIRKTIPMFPISTDGANAILDRIDLALVQPQVDDAMEILKQMDNRQLQSIQQAYESHPNAGPYEVALRNAILQYRISQGYTTIVFKQEINT